jgi:hypothetical protein
MLREAGIPARARAGFAGYFTDGFFDDHWVVEVWDAWGLIPIHYDRLGTADIALLDDVAAGGPPRQAADAYRSDPRLPVPAPLADGGGGSGQ